MSQIENRFIRLRGYLSGKIGRPLTGKDLAELLDVSPPAINRIETGARPPSKTVALKLYQKFGINPNWYFFNIGPAPWELDKGPQERESKVLPFRKAPVPGPGKLTYESLEVDPDIPAMPKSLSSEERKRWARNVETLRRWARSRPREALMVPSWAYGRFCREVEAAYAGGKLDDVTGELKDFIKEVPK